MGLLSLGLSAQPSLLLATSSSHPGAPIASPAPEVLIPKVFDPKGAVVIGRPGALSTWGDEQSTYDIAMNAPSGWARLAALNGTIFYAGKGRYYDEERKPIEPSAVLPRYESVLREQVGPRILPADHTIRTPFAGLIPAGLQNIKQVMGLTKAAVAKTSFANSWGSLIEPSQEDVLYMLYAGARMLINNGHALGEIFDDPRNLGLRSGRGLPGVAAFIRLTQAAEKGRQRTGGMLLPQCLQSAAMGVWMAMVGPKEATIPEQVDLSRGVRSMGRNMQGSAECATFLALMADAADGIGNTKAGQVARLAAQVGVGEAPHGTQDARICAVGFNSMMAMEAWSKVEARGADQDLWHGYCPFLEGSDGFWPGSGGAMASIYDLRHAVKSGLLFDAILGGWAVYPDQGNKANHAEIGIGIYNAILEAFQMAEGGHGISPQDLDYVNFHGTGTPDTNKKEPLTLTKALRDLGYKKGEKRIKITALKALLTHGLGVAGGLELSILLLAIRNQRGPGIFNMQDGRKLVVPADIQEYLDFSDEPILRDIRVVGTASEGFSGNNVFNILLQASEEQLLRYRGITRDDIRVMQELQEQRALVAAELDELVRTNQVSMTEVIDWASFKNRQLLDSSRVTQGWMRSLSPKAQRLKEVIKRFSFSGDRWIAPLLGAMCRSLSEKSELSELSEALDDIIKRIAANDSSAFFALTGLPNVIKSISENDLALEHLAVDESVSDAILDYVNPQLIERVSPHKLSTDAVIPASQQKVSLSSPGQGAFATKRQELAKKLYDTNEDYRAVIDEAHSRLAEKYGYDLMQMLFHGSEEDLLRTIHQQPVLVADELGRLAFTRRALEAAGATVVSAYGDSVGLIPAAYQAGYFASAAEAVEFAYLRAQVMGPLNPFGTEARPMAITDKLYDEAAVRSVVAEVNDVMKVHVTVSKRNAVGKLVVSGDPQGIAMVGQRLASKGAGLTEIPVSTPFHDAYYFEDAAHDLLRLAEAAGISRERRDDAVTLIANSTGEPLAADADILAFLAGEIAAPVDLVTSMQNAAQGGANVFLEVGPAATMTNNVATALGSMETTPDRIRAQFIAKPEDVATFLEASSEDDQ